MHSRLPLACLLLAPCARAQPRTLIAEPGDERGSWQVAHRTDRPEPEPRQPGPDIGVVRQETGRERGEELFNELDVPGRGVEPDLLVLRVQDDRITLRQIRHAGADLFNPAGVLMPKRERHLVGHAVLEHALHEVQVGATHPGPGDPHDHGVLDIDGVVAIAHPGSLQPWYATLQADWGFDHDEMAREFFRRLASS